MALKFMLTFIIVEALALIALKLQIIYYKARNRDYMNAKATDISVAVLFVSIVCSIASLIWWVWS